MDISVGFGTIMKPIYTKRDLKKPSKKYLTTHKKYLIINTKTIT
jgi:hypothetical protein